MKPKKPNQHQTGYHVYLFGLKYWHRSRVPAIRRAEKARNWCPNPQVIEITTGREG